MQMQAETRLHRDRHHRRLDDGWHDQNGQIENRQKNRLTLRYLPAFSPVGDCAGSQDPKRPLSIRGREQGHPGDKFR